MVVRRIQDCRLYTAVSLNLIVEMGLVEMFEFQYGGICLYPCPSNALIDNLQLITLKLYIKSKRMDIISNVGW